MESGGEFRGRGRGCGMMRDEQLHAIPELPDGRRNRSEVENEAQFPWNNSF